MKNVLIIIHVIIALILIVVVLMQHGKQQGLSGAIAGGAETFFGKNKGRTIDAILRKFTSVIAALFIISSVALALVSLNENKPLDAPQEVQQQEETAPQLTLDADGNMVDENGNVIMTKEDLAKAEAEAAEGQADANAETPAE